MNLDFIDLEGLLAKGTEEIHSLIADLKDAMTTTQTITMGVKMIARFRLDTLEFPTVLHRLLVFVTFLFALTA